VSRSIALQLLGLARRIHDGETVLRGSPNALTQNKSQEIMVTEGAGDSRHPGRLGTRAATAPVTAPGPPSG